MVFYKLKLTFKKLVPYRLIILLHRFRAMAAAFRYFFPARKLIVIGVAGTKGKTTTANLITKILEENGAKVAMFSTANIRLAGKEELNRLKMTTPSPWFMQKFLSEANKKGCQYAVLEVSSHGLAQYRHWGIIYQTVLITNLTPDHLDYHKTAESYCQVHFLMISLATRNLIVNSDDNNSSMFLITNPRQKYCFSLNGQKIALGETKGEKQKIKLVYVKDYQLLPSSSIIKISTPKGELEINFALPGIFNIYNVLAAVSVGVTQSIDLTTIKKALEKVKGVPGRLEKIDEGQNFELIVDYAHSPESLKNFYEAVSRDAKGKIIAVLGACGDRDKTIRPTLGKLAAEYADYVIVTNEDPYSEDPAEIMEQVAKGVEEAVGESRIPEGQVYGAGKNQESRIRVKEYWKILDRKEAIKKAIDIASKDDLILITGKGAEQCIVSGDKKIPWDDRVVTRELIQEKLRLATK